MFFGEGMGRVSSSRKVSTFQLLGRFWLWHVSFIIFVDVWLLHVCSVCCWLLPGSSGYTFLCLFLNVSFFVSMAASWAVSPMWPPPRMPGCQWLGGHTQGIAGYIRCSFYLYLYHFIKQSCWDLPCNSGLYMWDIHFDITGRLFERSTATHWNPVSQIRSLRPVHVYI